MTPEAFIADLEREFNTNQITTLVESMNNDDQEKMLQIVALIGTYPEATSLLESLIADGITDMDEALEFLQTNFPAQSEMGFLSDTTEVIETTGRKVRVKIPELEQMAQALHNAVGRCADEGGPTYVEVCSPLDDRFITLEMEILRPCSVHEIQDLLMPLFKDSV